MAKQTPIRQFDPKGSHTYLIDTNVLVYLFSPISSYDEKKQDIAGRFLEACRRVGSTLITTSGILSEFFHVNLRFYYEAWCKSQGSSAKLHPKKDYRPTDHYKESIQSIQAKMKSILKICHKVDDNFSSIDIDQLVASCLHAEFNDCYLIQLANDNDWYIVSNDADLLAHPTRWVEILTLD